MKNKVEKFWNIYRSYKNSYLEKRPETILRPRLSSLLAEIETPDRRKQVAHPHDEKTPILGWQVLRNQLFYNDQGHSFQLYEGELLGWDGLYDRDIFLSRIPYAETISGYILNPGITKKDPNQDVYNDQRGLYLPIYDPLLLVSIYKKEMERTESSFLKYVIETKGVSRSLLHFYF